MFALALAFCAGVGAGLAVAQSEQKKAVPVDTTYASKPMMAWTIEDVSSWVRCIGPAYAVYAPKFHENGINGTALATMSDYTLAKLGIDNEVHRHVLLTRRPTTDKPH